MPSLYEESRESDEKLDKVLHELQRLQRLDRDIASIASGFEDRLESIREQLKQVIDLEERVLKAVTPQPTASLVLTLGKPVAQ